MILIPQYFNSEEIRLYWLYVEDLNRKWITDLLKALYLTQKADLKYRRGKVLNGVRDTTHIDRPDSRLTFT